MLHISFEIPDTFNLQHLQNEMHGFPLHIEELPGTTPRLCVAMSDDPSLFYRLGGIVAIMLLRHTLAIPAPEV